MCALIIIIIISDSVQNLKGVWVHNTGAWPHRIKFEALDLLSCNFKE